MRLDSRPIFPTWNLESGGLRQAYTAPSIDETEEEDRSVDNNDDGHDSDNYDYDEIDEGGDKDEDENEEPTYLRQW